VTLEHITYIKQTSFRSKEGKKQPQAITTIERHARKIYTCSLTFLELSPHLKTQMFVRTVAGQDHTAVRNWKVRTIYNPFASAPPPTTSRGIKQWPRGLHLARLMVHLWGLKTWPGDTSTRPPVTCTCRS
jgi:hypothetical protein